MQPTKSREHAPEVLSYRQRLYDRETLMMPNEPWNPAQRLAQMRDNYDKLVAELGVSPRGPKHRGASIPPPTGEDTKLPRVPQSRTWTQPGGRSGRDFGRICWDSRFSSENTHKIAENTLARSL